MRINDLFSLQLSGNENAELFATTVAIVWDKIPIECRTVIELYYRKHGAPRICLRNSWDRHSGNCLENFIFGEVLLDGRPGVNFAGEEINYCAEAVDRLIRERLQSVLESLIAHELAHIYQHASGSFYRNWLEIQDTYGCLDQKQAMEYWMETDAERLERIWGFDRDGRDTWKSSLTLSFIPGTEYLL